MNKKNIMLAGLMALGLIGSQAEARRHHHHAPRVSFGFQVAAPVRYAQPVYVAAPCRACHTCYAPVVYQQPRVRPQVGFSVGTGPVSFGFWN